MAEVSITKWLDPAFKYFAEQSGIPVDQYSSQVGGEGIGTALEVVADFFTKGWLNKAIQASAGLIADGYAIWGKDVPTRLRKELLALGTHELLRIVDPKPSDVIEFQRSLTQFINGMKRGDYNAALSSVLRTPGEITAMAAAMGIPVGTKTPAGQKTPTPKYRQTETQPTPSIPTPASERKTGIPVKPESETKTGTKGKYSVTG